MTHNESDDDNDTGATCPTCGRSDFKNKRGMRQHHAKAHGESLIYETVECAWCGGEKTARIRSDMSLNHRFCDGGCRGKWLSEHRSGENHPSWNGGKATVECAHCGAEKRVKRHELDDYDHHFCDGDCYGAWKRENHVGEGHPRYNRVSTKCAWCETEMTRSKHRFERTNNSFCSDDCFGAWATERTGERAGNWKGGEAHYGIGWTEEKRETVRELQGRKCAGCGIREDDHYRRLDVHHIQPVRSFDDPADAHVLDNLVALCQPCHLIWEKMAPLRPEYADRSG